MVFRAIPRDAWQYPYDVLRESYHRQIQRGRFNLGRWNHDDQYTLYTSRDVETAVIEASQIHTPDRAGAVSLAGSDLLDDSDGARPEWAVIEFEMPWIDPAEIYDGDAQRLLDRSDVGRLLAPRPDYEASREFAAERRLNGSVELIVPSAPGFNAEPRAILWNDVLFGGKTGQPDPLALPAGGAIRLVAYA